MPTPGQGTIGSLDYPKSERIKLAKKSISFVCRECTEGDQPVSKLLKTPDPEAPSITEDADLKKIVSNVLVKGSSEEKPISKKEVYLRKRKEASTKMQARFKEKLMSRTPELVKQVEQSKAAKLQRAAPAPSATNSAATRTSAPITGAPTGGQP